MRRDLTASEQEWLRVRAHLRGHRHDLALAAAARHPDLRRIEDTALLTTPAWILDAPIPLHSIELTWTAEADRPDLFPPAALTAHVRPTGPGGTAYPSYSAAMADLAAPSIFQNRSTYRLRAADLTGSPRLDFEPGRYFDGIDVGEAVAHELAAYELGSIEGTPLRDWIADPCAPARRPISLGISALTLRCDRGTGRSTFPLHWRDPAKVGHAGDTYMVIPAGIFQALDDRPERQPAELSVWQCLVREYGEELLGRPESESGGDAAGRLIEQMTAAVGQGRIAARVLGLGVDPLTLATDLLLSVEIDSDVYDLLFTDAVRSNNEGEFVVAEGSADRLFPFRGEEVDRLVRGGRMQAAGAAILRLAWQAL